MEKEEYEAGCHRDGVLAVLRSTTQRKLANLNKNDPAILDYDATKTKLQNELNAIIQEQGMIRAELEEARPQLNIQASRSTAKTIPKILLSVSLDQQPKDLDHNLSYEHRFQPCNHTAKLDIYDLIPDSQPAAWNALIDQLAVFDGMLNCPNCISEKNSLRAKLREQINALRARMPEATIADQEPRKTISTARFNVHIKK